MAGVSSARVRGSKRIQRSQATRATTAAATAAPRRPPGRQSRASASPASRHNASIATIPKREKIRQPSVTSQISFGGSGSNASSITWKASTHVLTVTLGSGSGANSDYNAVTSSQPVYTASPSTTNPTGQAVDNSPYDLPAAKHF